LVSSIQFSYVAMYAPF